MAGAIASLGGILAFASCACAGASFAALGRKVFAKYCGHNIRWVQKPVEGMELIQVQVIHRHGARSLWAPLQCWARSVGAPSEHPPFRCNLPFSISVGRARPLTKHFDQPGGCGLGSLLDEAPEQFKNLAWSLNASYQHTSLWKHLSLSDDSVYLYSCDNERNLASVDLLTSQLFAGSQADSAVEIHTLPAKDDPFELPGCVATSPCDGSPVQAMEEIEMDKNYRAFASTWLQQANVSWNRENFDCILTARCAGLGLPTAIHNELADEALYWGWRQQMAPVRTTNWTSLVASRALEAIANKLKMASDGPKLAVWSTHDSTMIYLLNALGGWDGRWPGYASVVVLELYASPNKGEGETLLRVVRDGEPLTLGVCGEVLCPLSRFLAAVESWQNWGCAPETKVFEELYEGSWLVWALLSLLMILAALFGLPCRGTTLTTVREPLIA
ncbi:Acp6 [Symbiodinium natans]|uniref:Acp6 protein n=1 Tax=Symbiodinium natans TaxID=878477 RepID=A0A812U1S2_9DINO|nr:Acp6 [Symbiodinium natans]